MKKQDGKQTGRANYVWTLAGVYLIYLSGKLLLGQAGTVVFPQKTELFAERHTAPSFPAVKLSFRGLLPQFFLFFKKYHT